MHAPVHQNGRSHMHRTENSCLRWSRTMTGRRKKNPPACRRCRRHNRTFAELTHPSSRPPAERRARISRSQDGSVTEDHGPRQALRRTVNDRFWNAPPSRASAHPPNRRRHPPQAQTGRLTKSAQACMKRICPASGQGDGRGCRGLPVRRAAVLVVLLLEILPHRACGQSVVVLRN